MTQHKAADSMFDYVVVGNGLIGSAAGRYLSESGRRTAIIGPEEPQNWATHRGVFASHYDQGRITRILDADLVWATVAKRSLAQYASIEQKSGIKFHHPVGGLRVDQNPRSASDTLRKIEKIGHQLGADFTRYDSAGLEQAYPWLNVAQGTIGLAESSPAGYIQPRRLIAAQGAIAKQHGAYLSRETVTVLRESGQRVQIETVQGTTYHARKVLIAAGAYTNTLLPRKLALTPIPRTILLAEMSGQDLSRLAGMPTLIAALPADAPIDSVYVLPPIRYPDGTYYLKIGGGDRIPEPPCSTEALTAWFQTGGDQRLGETLRAVLHSLLPGLRPTAYVTKPCVTTHTPTGYPYIDQVTDHIFVAAGGCGYAAKSSNEIGRLAAHLTGRATWTDTLDSTLFDKLLYSPVSYPKSP